MLHWWNFSFNQKTHMDALRLLIKRGVNVNAVDTRGRTALMLLLVPGDDQPTGPQLEAIKVLVAAGTDLRIKNEWGETAMSLGLASKFPSVRSYFKELANE
jgi:ankyrin repeat protein